MNNNPENKSSLPIFSSTLRATAMFGGFVALLLMGLQIQAQDFFRNDFNREKEYVLLANPTVKNLETIQFLIKHKLLKVNPGETHFVGIWHQEQQYNFANSIKYIRENELINFDLHEIRTPLEVSELFERNGLTDELQYIFDNTIGIFFFGGPDIPPEIYGEENSSSIVTDPVRHQFECTFLFHLLGGYQDESFDPFLDQHPDYLVTGFCLGMQTMNVATGGTLIQDIPIELHNANTPEEIIASGSENMHRNYWNKISNAENLATINFHRIHISGNPFFKTRIKVSKKLTPKVYSSHHQAVERIGKNLEITATSIDGEVVEGLSHSRYEHVFSVQFHPEVPALYEDREKYRISPSDEPRTFHQMLTRKDLKFHKKYWNYISRSLSKASR